MDFQGKHCFRNSDKPQDLRIEFYVKLMQA